MSLSSLQPPSHNTLTVTTRVWWYNDAPWVSVTRELGKHLASPGCPSVSGCHHVSPRVSLPGSGASSVITNIIKVSLHQLTALMNSGAQDVCREESKGDIRSRRNQSLSSTVLLVTFLGLGAYVCVYEDWRIYIGLLISLKALQLNAHGNYVCFIAKKQNFFIIIYSQLLSPRNLYWELCKMTHYGKHLLIIFWEIFTPQPLPSPESHLPNECFIFSVQIKRGQADKHRYNITLTPRLYKYTKRFHFHRISVYVLAHTQGSHHCSNSHITAAGHCPESVPSPVIWVLI